MLAQRHPGVADGSRCEQHVVPALSQGDREAEKGLDVAAGADGREEKPHALRF